MVQKEVKKVNKKTIPLVITLFLIFAFTSPRASEPAEFQDGAVEAEEGIFIGFLWPLRGDASSTYGMRRDPISGDIVRRHSGVDLAAPVGALVTASRAGRVTFAGTRGGYGKLVTIIHANDMETRYGHLSAINVKQDNFVRPGQVIGKAGGTGRSTGSHLHFEIRQSGRAVDPMKWLVPYGFMMPPEQTGSSR